MRPLLLIAAALVLALLLRPVPLWLAWAYGITLVAVLLWLMVRHRLRAPTLVSLWRNWRYNKTDG